MYEQFYGFSARPFQLTPDPQFYFESASHKKAMSYLGYGLAQAEGFIVITGAVGAGKSTLVGQLTQRVDPAVLTVGQIVTSALDGLEVVQVVAQAFGLPIEGRDKGGALGAIERFLQDEARAGRRCLLIVDECQNLTLEALEELRMLSNFQLGAHPLLQSLLLGQPEFRRTLANHPGLEQLRQRIIASHHLDALDESEVGGYIAYRLGQVGWDGMPEFAEGLVTELYRQTEGVPRRINQVMNRLLLLGAIEERAELTLEMLSDVIAEMASDQNRGGEVVSLVPAVAYAPAPVAATLAPGPIASAPDDRAAALEAAIGELQAAGRLQPGLRDPDAARQAAEAEAELALALERLEARIEEQERSFRHVLAMLIEWLEDTPSREAA